MNRNSQQHMTTTFKASVALMSTAWDLFLDSLESLKDVPGITYALGFQPFPVALLESSAALGGNSLGLEADIGPLIMVCLFAQWANKEDDEKMLNTERVLVKAIEAAAKKEGLDVEYKFTNYCFTGQDPITGYGKESKRRLQFASEKYDPEGFFQKIVPGGFKLFDQV
jgi:hypothetical protein